MIDRLFRHRHALRSAGLTLLAAGLALVLLVGADAGLPVVAAAVVLLASVQPLILAWLRSRAVRHVAPQNGHAPRAGAEDLELRR